MLKINISYGANRRKSKEEQQATEAEKYHTYGSLFYRLREYLDNQKLIKRLDDGGESWSNIKPSSFVEIRGIFRPNPLVKSLEIIDGLIEMTQLLYGVGPMAGGQTNRSSKGKRTPQQQKVTGDMGQMTQIRKFLGGVRDGIQKENIRAFVVDVGLDLPYRSVVLIFVDYLRDKTMTELSYKEYRLLGKVVRKIEASSKESIDLLTGTALGGIGDEQVQQLLNAFTQMPNMNFPEIRTKIEGPVMEVVPVAIFV